MKMHEFREEDGEEEIRENTGKYMISGILCRLFCVPLGHFTSGSFDCTFVQSFCARRAMSYARPRNVKVFVYHRTSRLPVGEALALRALDF